MISVKMNWDSGNPSRKQSVDELMQNYFIGDLIFRNENEQYDGFTVSGTQVLDDLLELWGVMDDFLNKGKMANEWAPSAEIGLITIKYADRLISFGHGEIVFLNGPIFDFILSLSEVTALMDRELEERYLYNFHKIIRQKINEHNARNRQTVQTQ
jgi:hypothetical protein